MILYCATTNPGKLREFRMAAERFAPGRFQFELAAGIAGIPPCEETGTSFEENAIQKAVYYSARAPGLLFSDDSGLEVPVLGGAPGVSSARFAGPAATDTDNNRRLLETLAGRDDRRAAFVCVVALAKDGRLIRTFRGAVEGRILEEPRGTNGFGYDPLFFYQPFGCTFGEVETEQKLSVSHRGRAVAAMLDYLAGSEEVRQTPGAGPPLPLP